MHGSWSGFKALWERMCSNGQDRVRDLGFGPFLSLLVLKANKALMMTLAERWLLITQTFHLPIRETGMPPINFFMMTSFLMDDTPPPSTNKANVEMVTSCLGP